MSGLVLCADDDEDILALVSLRLTRAGYEVVTAGDGQAALDIARQRPPKVAVLDMMMPRLTGLQVVEQMKRDPALAGVRIVILSARVQESDVQAGLAGGADAYLIKPFKFDELVTLVARLAS